MTRSPTPLLQPFIGERYAAAALDQLLAPPYDVISPADRAALVANSSHNIVQLILPDGNGDRYEHAATLRRQWRADGVLVRDPEPSVYVVAQRSKLPDGRETVRTGMLAAVVAEPYQHGRVRPHEKTHAGPKADRLALLRTLRGTFESIFLIAPDKGGVLRDRLAQAVRAQPTARGTVSGVEVTLWRVSGPDAAALTASADGAPLYIADGHHRYETTLAYSAENPVATRTVALVVPATDSGLTVLATHRIIRGGPISLAQARDILSPWFVVTDIGSEIPARALERLGKQGTACVVALTEGMLTGVLRADAASRLVAEFPEAAVRDLDVARVDRLVVSPLRERSGGGLGLEYTADLDTGLAAVKQGAAAVVLLNPTTVAQVFAVADAKGVMPQKSTYFIPKVPSGLAGLSYES